MERSETNKETNKVSQPKTYRKVRDKKDVIFGIFMLLFGFIFFIISTFTIIISKVIKITDKQKAELPLVIQFLINDKHYIFCIILSIPVTLILFTLRRIAFLYFRHIY